MMELIEAKRVAEILSELNELAEYKKMLENKEHGRLAHFELCQHFGPESRKIVFGTKHTPKFIAVVEQVIKELNDELSAI